MQYIDLFGGIGGFRHGIEKATKGEWECVWYCDNDKYAVQTYNKNFKTNHKAANIREVRSENIPSHELICAGFPCQSFSIAGKRLGFNDTRGTLFYEILRIARHHRTKYLFLENVKGLLSHDKGRTFATILASLDECGYNAQWQVLNSKHHGVPQNRERIFIIANLRSESRPKVFPIGLNAGKIQEVHGGEKVIIANCLDANMHKGIDPKGFFEKKKRNVIPVPMVVSPFGNYKSENTCGTLGAGCGRSMSKTWYVINGLRRLTPIECERLQGFPDNWTKGCSDTQRYKQLGNAVTVNVIEAIIKSWTARF